MTYAYHNEVAIGDIHIAHDKEYATQAARLAATSVTASDVDKLIKQLSDGSFWRITAIGSPITTVPFAPPPPSVSDIGKSLVVLTDGSGGVKFSYATGGGTGTLDDAYNADAGAAGISVDAGDITWTVSGAYSIVHDVAAVTGTTDGFSVVCGADQFDLIHKGVNALELDADLSIAHITTESSSSFTVTGVGSDLTLGARGSTITLNQIGQTALDASFGAAGATSIIGALNVLVTGPGILTDLNEAYDNFGANPAIVTIDNAESQGDLQFKPTGAYSLIADISGCTGTSDGFFIENGADYLRFYYNGADDLVLTSALGQFSLNALNSSTIRSLGATSDLTLGARATTITLNDVANTALVGFTATSIIGALNENKTTIGALTYDDIYNAESGEHVITMDDGAMGWYINTTNNFVIDCASANTPVVNGTNVPYGFRVVNGADAWYVGKLATDQILFHGEIQSYDLNVGGNYTVDVVGTISIDATGTIDWSGTNAALTTLGNLSCNSATLSGTTAAFTANSLSLDYSSGSSRLIAVGADASTAGALTIGVSSTDGSPAYTSLSMVADGNVGIGVIAPSAKLEVSAGSIAATALLVNRAYDGSRILIAYSTTTDAYGEIGQTYNTAGQSDLWIGSNLDSSGAAHSIPLQCNAGGASWFTLHKSIPGDEWSVNRIAPGGGSTASKKIAVDTNGVFDVLSGGAYANYTNSALSMGWLSGNYSWIQSRDAAANLSLLLNYNGGDVYIGPYIIVDTTNQRFGVNSGTPQAAFDVRNTSGGEIARFYGSDTNGTIGFFSPTGNTARGSLGFGGSGIIFTDADTNSVSFRSEASMHLGANGDNLALTLDSNNVLSQHLGGTYTNYANSSLSMGFNSANYGWIQARDAAANLPLYLNYNGGDVITGSNLSVGGYITTVSGNLSITPNGGYVEIGSGYGASYASTSNDLVVGDILEIGGVTYHDALVQDKKGSDLASANDMAAPNGNYCDVTGTTQINTMSTTGIQAGTCVTLQFDSGLTVKHATAGTGAQFYLKNASDYVVAANYTLTVTYDGTYWRETSRNCSNGTSFPSFQFFADSLDSPNNADWAVNALAPLASDTNNAALNVRLFDDTTEEGVGFSLTTPTGATNIVIKLKSRAETGAASNLNVVPKLYVREMPDNAAVESWSAGTDLTTITMGTSNEYFQYDEQTIALSTLSLVAGRSTQFELTRNGGSGSDTLSGDWALLAVEVYFT